MDGSKVFVFVGGIESKQTTAVSKAHKVPLCICC